MRLASSELSRTVPTKLTRAPAPLDFKLSISVAISKSAVCTERYVCIIILLLQVEKTQLRQYLK